MLMEAFCAEITWRDKDPEITQGKREAWLAQHPASASPSSEKSE